MVDIAVEVTRNKIQVALEVDIKAIHRTGMLFGVSPGIMTLTFLRITRGTGLTESH